MDEAKQLLKLEIDKYRSLSFEELKNLIHDKAEAQVNIQRQLANGEECQIDINIAWEDKDKSIRVIGFVDLASQKRWWQKFISTQSYGFIKNIG